METVYFQGTPCHTCGTLPAAGDKAPAFCLTTEDLSEIRNTSFPGKTIILNVFPSLDTPVCAASVRRFNVDAAKLPDTVVVCVSMDLPFAMKRFCVANGIENVKVASAFRSPEFGQRYGVTLVDGPLAGLLTRSVFVIDPDGKILYRQLVDEITSEPDYDAVLAAM